MSAFSLSVRIALLATSIAAMVGAGRAEDRISLNVSLGDVSLNKVAFLVAADNGIYEKNGLEVHQFITKGAAARISKSGVNVPEEYVGGNEDEAEISIGGGSPLIVSMTSDAETPQRVILATTDNTAKFHIIANKDIKGLDDLKGKRLGYSSVGSVSHVMALALLQKKGWSPDTDISLMGEGMGYPQLTSGRVDAFIGSEIYYTMAEKNGAVDLVDLRDFDIPVAGSSVNALSDWLPNNRETAMRFVKSTIDAYALMKKDKSVAFAAMAKWYNVTDAKQQEEMYEQVAAVPEKPYPAVDGIKQVMSLYTYHELSKHKPEDFYDDSFVKELDQSGYIDKAYGK